MELQHRMVAVTEQATRRDLTSFRHWSGRARCAVCGRALGREQREIRVHGVPVHTSCAGFKIRDRAA